MLQDSSVFIIRKYSHTISFKSIIIISTKLAVRMEDNEELETKFLDLIPQKMADPPWNYSGTLERGLTVSKVLQ